MEGRPGGRHVQVPEGGTVHTFLGYHFLPSGLALPLRFLWNSSEFAHGSLWKRGTEVVGAYVRSMCVVRDLKLFKKKKCTTTNFYPFGTVWRKHAFTALGGKLNAYVQTTNSNECKILRPELEIRTARFAAVSSSLLRRPDHVRPSVVSPAKVPDPVSLLRHGS